MKPPSISVVMPVFNGSRYLAKSMGSILAQNCGDFEFIIVNDGSDDDTRNILHAYRDPRIRLIDHQQNEGLTRSLIHATRESRGQYIARQDSDDVSDPNRLGAQLAYMEANPRVAAVGSWALQIDDDGDEIALLERETEPEKIRSRLPLENQFHHGSVMFRRSALDKIGGYRAQFRFAQDYDLFLRFSLDFDLANLKQPLYSKRHSPEAVSIIHAGEQQSFSDLALELYRQRLEKSCDDLDSGKTVDELLKKPVDKPRNYEKNLVNIYLRSDKCKKARPYILNDIKTSPYRLKPYLQYGLTYLNRHVRDKLFRIWDQDAG